MDRRSFVTSATKGAAGAALREKPREQLRPEEPRGLEYANKELPRGLARTQAGLEQYTGPWTFEQAAHLLRRTMFGAKKADVDRVLGKSMSDTVDLLLASWTPPSPPVAPKDETYRDTNGNTITVLKAGEVWVNAAYESKVDTQRLQSLQSWWIGLMVDQDISVREKMTLFWHNHFASEYTDVLDSRFMYKQNALFREYALGNFKDLVRAVTLDPAMLRYLNGNTNISKRPNENYARELQELFTIGKGPEIAPGDYTNYTEADVVAAARVLTGWRDDRASIGYTFSSGNHDTGDKVFSADYGDRTIKGGTGSADQIKTHALRELDELLTMIFDQQATAEYICRKLYRWFIYYVIDDTAEATVIQPLAAQLRISNFEIKPVLEILLKSAHFFDSINIGCVIKNPIDHVVGSVRALPMPLSTELLTRYVTWNFFRDRASAMQMNLLGPPNVAGWPAYYQDPVFYEIWLNSDTLPRRFTITDQFTAGYSLTIQTNPTVRYALKIDVIAYAQQVSDPSDPNLIVGEWARFLYPQAISDTQKNDLKKALVVENQDYDWTNLWNAFLSNPTANQKAVEDKLRILLKAMLTMAEYQLM